MKLLLAGATGLVGRHVLALALAEPRITAVTAPVRRALPPHPKLLAPLVEFGHLPEAADWWAADAAICALGTTRRAAGSAAAFRQVDYAYPMAVARLARAHGAPTFVLNSAMGADPASRFLYTRTKGELERDLEHLAFPSLTLVRPGLIGGTRDHPRLGEQIASAILGTLGPALPRGLRINPAETIARAMLDSALSATVGKHVIQAATLVGEPRRPDS